MSSDIQFNDKQDPQLRYTRVERSNRTPKMVRWLIDKGWAKDEKMASKFLLVVVAVSIIATILVFALNDSPDIQDDTLFEDHPNLLG